MDRLDYGYRADRAIKKLTERDAEIAFWFHVNPKDLTPAERIGYLANLERCKAQQVIHLGKYNPSDYRGVYQLYLLAFGDEDVARRAQVRAAELLVEQRCRR